MYTEAVTRNPNDAIALISLGMALLRQERITEALQHLTHAVEVCVYCVFVPVSVCSKH